MDRLILLRHGKAENESASGEDFDRRLAPRGVRESTEMGETLARLGLIPDLALVSPAARAQETWAAAAEAAFPKAQSRLEPELYNADSGTVRQAAEAAGRGCGTLIVVGHNPGLQELTLQLLMEGSAPAQLIGKARQFPTAAAAVFLIDANGRPAFDGLFFPER